MGFSYAVKEKARDQKPCVPEASPARRYRIIYGDDQREKGEKKGWRSEKHSDVFLGGGQPKRESRRGMAFRAGVKDYHVAYAIPQRVGGVKRGHGTCREQNYRKAEKQNSANFQHHHYCSRRWLKLRITLGLFYTKHVVFRTTNIPSNPFCAILNKTIIESKKERNP